MGHIVGQGLRRPIEIKMLAVKEFPQPKTQSDIRTFLGLTGYYQRFIRNYSQVASPLTDALRKTEPKVIVWTDQMEQSFNNLKQSLTTKPVLRAPDYTTPFIVQCDASNRGIGVVLCQKDENGHENPSLYASR